MRLFAGIFEHYEVFFLTVFSYLKTRKVPKYLSSGSFSSTDAFFLVQFSPSPSFHGIFPHILENLLLTPVLFIQKVMSKKREIFSEFIWITKIFLVLFEGLQGPEKYQ